MLRIRDLQKSALACLSVTLHVWNWRRNLEVVTRWPFEGTEERKSAQSNPVASRNRDPATLGVSA